MINKELARIFGEIADILEFDEENPFRIRAYRRAAVTMDGLSEDVKELIARDALTSLPGIGKDLAEKIRSYAATGKIEFYERLKKEAPPAYLDFIKIPGVGPKTAKLLITELKVKDLADLERKARAKKLSVIPHLKEKTEENILKALQFLKKDEGRMLLSTAFETASEIIGSLEKNAAVRAVSEAGSLRRRKETVRDIDILVSSRRAEKVMDAFVSLPGVERVISRGDTRAGVITGGRQVDIRVVEPESYGAALLYFTGSKEHNIRLRKMAMGKGLKINEYGLYRASKRGKKPPSKGMADKRIAGRTENEMYGALGLRYIGPELREDAGEIEAARRGGLPRLVEEDDIAGDLHIHSAYSDGELGLDGIVREAVRRGYEYIAVTDHSQSLHVASGVARKEKIRQIEEIGKLNRDLKGLTVLAGAEVDILDDGGLDYDEEILGRLDFVIAAIHTGFKWPKDRNTHRLVSAARNRYVHVIAHPSGRLLGEREGYEVDYEELFKAAAEGGTAIEINAYPRRLDLTDTLCRRAKELGVKFIISTDAHRPEQWDNMRYGISVARRGWLEKKDVLNTLPLDRFLKAIKK